MTEVPAAPEPAAQPITNEVTAATVSFAIMLPTVRPVIVIECEFFTGEPLTLVIVDDLARQISDEIADRLDSNQIYLPPDPTA